MKKMIIGIIALSLSGVAFASGYSDAVKQQAKCEEWGNVGVYVFSVRDDPVKKAKYSANSDELIANGMEAMKSDDKGVRFEAYENIARGEAISNSLFVAADSKKAYMFAWGKCMDQPLSAYSIP